MLLLGRDWMEFTIADHDTEVWWDAEHGLWRWACVCELHEGYGNRRERVVDAARRHAAMP